MNFEEKHAIITGGSSGIGKALAVLLAQQGANITIIARHPEQLEIAQKEIIAAQKSNQQKAIAIVADVAISQQAQKAIQDAIAQLGKPQLLVTAAGIAHPGYFQDIPLTVFEKTMAVNYFGTLYCLKAALPALQQQAQSHIVLISSGAGLMGIYGYSAYSPSKFAVRGLAEVLRSELKPYQVKVSVVYPPDTNTPQFMAENRIKPPETKAITATAKLWNADDVAQIILQGIRSNTFVITPGIEMTLLAKLHSILANFLNAYFNQIVKKVRRANTTTHAV
ncbi:MAG: SDR family oxidoreductase [Jaaginema sp. PMC 1079.18]|nr:SDR family oxidoreductase [Jaaginema sp. PMC 1080.18]MEC4851381.1 SDR family oxidoreductase [Jaaginema sp. PMC 1079.18]MEC4866424.1 SDR family oxidoreductase [Jaaginema sp. PMC 1078.18]